MNTRNSRLVNLLVVPVFSCLFLPQVAARAQQGATKTVKIGGNLNVEAGSVKLFTGAKQGALIEGTPTKPAHIWFPAADAKEPPQLDVTSPHIEILSDKNNTLKGVVATKGVQFEVSLSQKNGPPVRVQAKCDNATLNRTDAARVLTLNGGVDGWFQSGDGPRNQLRGQTVTITSQPDAATSLIADIKGDTQGIRVDVPPDGKSASGVKPVIVTAQNAQLRQGKNGLEADVDGGTQGVRMEIPPQPKTGNASALAMGMIVLTAQRASVRQADGTAHLMGNAHAASNGEGQGTFDVAADEFTLSRKPDGEIDVLKSKGRTRLKLGLPPDANAKPLVATKNKIAFGKPDYIEVESNSATADLAKNTLIFEGDVKGFYRLPTANAPAATPSKDYKFSGQRAIMSYAPETGDIARGLNVEVEGGTEQAVIELPGFSIDNF